MQRVAKVCGCGRVVQPGATCPCKRLADQARGTSRQRGYDRGWEQLRARFLGRHPTCCTPGCDRPATVVDHVLSVAERPDLRLVWDNLRSMCTGCHGRRTIADQPPGSRPKGGGSRNFVAQGVEPRGSTERDIPAFFRPEAISRSRTS